MKIKLLVTGLLTLSIMSCNDKPFQIDEVLLQCYETTYKDKGYNIKTIIKDYESVLVKEGVLNDDSGKSYLQVIQNIYSDSDFRISAPNFQDIDPFFKLDNKIKMDVIECEREMIELANQTDSKWAKLSGNFQSQETNKNPKQMYEDMVASLSENDLNSYYFKLKMFRLFDMVNPKLEN